jgi:hypothetical protein
MTKIEIKRHGTDKFGITAKCLVLHRNQALLSHEIF